MDFIHLHRKYGLNPTIPVCFWCGNDRNEVALLGSKYKDQAPQYMVIDYQPCEACQTSMSQGVTLMEASTNRSKGMPPIQPGVYPTGRWWVITREAANRIFDGMTSDKAFIEVGVAEKIGLVPDLTGGHPSIN